MPFDCKLGLQRSPGSWAPLHLVLPTGGLVPQIMLLVQRKHPTIMWQRTPEGRPVLQSLKAHAAIQEAARKEHAKVWLNAGAHAGLQAGPIGFAMGGRVQSHVQDCSRMTMISAAQAMMISHTRQQISTSACAQAAEAIDAQLKEEERMFCMEHVALMGPAISKGMHALFDTEEAALPCYGQMRDGH